ncbi:hypothetical protein [Xenorhabdus griffiniae]|uniref:hypothetical protein n=1 Tax=Xenorhabdus griffiniae TaxID=351672 RepID=UPI002359BDF4|nr:hypothetical protein [Xenorhabdus griffiniae]MDC9606986.1 hypothetical protein [Xenorhabdus griffiniae]
MDNFFKKIIKILTVSIAIFVSVLVLDYLIDYNGLEVINKVGGAFKSYNENKKINGYNRFITPYHR